MKKMLLGAIIAAVLIFAGIIAYNALTAPTKAPSAPATVKNEQPAPSNAYRIVPASSKATYSIFEMLRGAPKTVIGTTSEIAGSFEADPSDLSKTAIGEIRVNARAFKTDDEKRDNATRRMILKTEDSANEFIAFKPRSITTDKNTVDLNTEFSIKITGDLTISGVTKESIWEGTGKFTNENEVTAAVKTTVKRSDYNLVVPNLPFLADVADEVPLQIDFVAKK